MSKCKHAVSTSNASVSAPVYRVDNLAGSLLVNGVLIPIPPVDSQWVAGWEQLKKETALKITIALAQSRPGGLRRDWAVGEIIDKAFDRQDQEFAFLDTFGDGWTTYDIEAQCGLERRQLWESWMLALWLPQDLMGRLADAGVSRRRVRDIVLLLKTRGKYSQLLEKLQRTVPRSRDNDERAVFYNWLDLQLFKNQPVHMRRRAAFQRWLAETYIGRCYALNMPMLQVVKATED